MTTARGTPLSAGDGRSHPTGRPAGHPPSATDVLALAERRIARATAIVERQRQIVRRAEAQRRSADLARALLRTMESVLATMTRNRDLAARTPFQAFTRNRLLRRLPHDDFVRVADSLEPIRLGANEVLSNVGEDASGAIFPEDGIVSAVTAADEKTLEVGTIGFEGMSGLELVVGASRTPLQYIVRFAGDGFRLPADRFGTLLELSPELRSLLQRYAYVFHLQTVASASAMGFATIEERLARCLLMYHDRLDGNELPITHDALAGMVGVRRASITEALHKLEGAHAIRAHRALVVVRNPRLLAQIARGTYGVVEAKYERLFRRE